MKNKLGKLFVTVGIALLITALSVFLWNKYDAYRADAAASEIMNKIESVIASDNDFDSSETADTAMKVKKIDGYGYIGYLSVPSLDLNLPIMSKWDYDRMKIAPCRYSGSTKTDDLVLAGHNYTRHFGRFSHLKEGDEVSFKDMEGVVTKYKVVATDILDPTAIEDMTSGEYALTLFTCTYGGKSRITIRCERVK